MELTLTQQIEYLKRQIKRREDHLLPQPKYHKSKPDKYLERQVEVMIAADKAILASLEEFVKWKLAGR